MKHSSKTKRFMYLNMILPLFMAMFINIGCYETGSSESTTDLASDKQSDEVIDENSFSIPFDTSLIERKKIVIPAPPAVIAYTDEAPMAGETVTDARIRSLNKYAKALLAAKDYDLMLTFDKDDINWKPLTECYEICVEGGSYFNENFRLGTIYDIKSSDDLNQMKTQIQNLVEFLYRFHLDANGNENYFFNKISIVPKGTIDNELMLKGNTLYIGVDYILWKITPVDSLTLRSDWTAGKHLDEYMSDLKSIWDSVDPVGAKKISLRDNIKESADFTIEMLNEVLNDKNLKYAKADMHDLIKYNVLPDLKTSTSNTLINEALANLDTMDLNEINELALIWKSFLQNSKNWEGMSDAVTATQQATKANCYDINIEQEGMVLVGNFHNILVDVSAFLPRNRYFLNYVTIQKFDQNINVKQHGMVCVYTIDNVEVNVLIYADLGIETAGLEYALNRMGM